MLCDGSPRDLTHTPTWQTEPTCEKLVFSLITRRSRIEQSSIVSDTHTAGRHSRERQALPASRDGDEPTSQNRTGAHAATARWGARLQVALGPRALGRRPSAADPRVRGHLEPRCCHRVSSQELKELRAPAGCGRGVGHGPQTAHRKRVFTKRGPGVTVIAESEVAVVARSRDPDARNKRENQGALSV